jgi:predicted RNA-binding protein with TRAM domain
MLTLASTVARHDRTVRIFVVFVTEVTYDRAVLIRIELARLVSESS